jgi:hypothetical protein
VSERKTWLAGSAAAYLLLVAVYLLYFNHVEFFVDDWFLTKQFRQALGRGPQGPVDFVVSAVQNNVYGKFRMHWLGILWGFLVTWLGGFNPKFNFVALLALHAACGWLFCQGLRRLGLDREVAFLAGALYLLAPTTHFALFSNFTNPFFTLPVFWILLMLWLFAGGRSTAAVCLCAVAGLFSGEQPFLLLCGLLPLAAWCFRVRGWLRPIAWTWVTLAAAGVSYLLWLNRAPVVQTGFQARYQWSWTQLGRNLELLWREISRLIEFRSDGPDWLLALAAAALIGALTWRWEGGVNRRLWIFAVAGLLLAYGPVLAVGGDYSRFRYHYVPSLFWGLLLAAVCASLPRPGRSLLAAAAAAFFTLNAAGDIRQCWIPMSKHHRALEARLRQLKDVAPGDILIISGAPYEIGTAQHPSMHTSVSANPFAEWATGVAPLEVGLEVRTHHDGLEVFQRDYRRGISAEELGRAHVLVESVSGVISSRRWVAQEVGGGRFRLLALKGSTSPAGVFSREQLLLAGESIYFAEATHQ